MVDGKWIAVECGENLAVVCEKRWKVATKWAENYDLLWKLDSTKKFKVIASSTDDKVSIQTDFLHIKLTEQADQARQILHPESLLTSQNVSLMDLFAPNLFGAALAEPPTFNHLVWIVPVVILLLILVIVLFSCRSTKPQKQVMMDPE